MPFFIFVDAIYVTLRLPLIAFKVSLQSFEAIDLFSAHFTTVMFCYLLLFSSFVSRACCLLILLFMFDIYYLMIAILLCHCRCYRRAHIDAVPYAGFSAISLRRHCFHFILRHVMLFH